MALALNKSLSIPSLSKKHKLGRGHMPSKRSINLALLDVKPFRIGLAIPTILLILVAAAAFSKFLVIDRLTEVSEAQANVSRLHAQINAGYVELADYDDLATLYAHYTFSGMTQEELRRTDRREVLALLQRTALPGMGISSWTLTGNQVVLNITGATLQDINLVAQKLEADDLVDYCTVTTATSREWDDRYNTEDRPEYSSTVTARVVIYLIAETEVPVK